MRAVRANFATYSWSGNAEVVGEKAPRQLVGDVEYEQVRDATGTGKAIEMTDKPEDAGRGALFKNEQKEKPSHPDYKGDVTIRGRKFWISAWIKTSEKPGKKFMSLAFREAEQQEAKAASQAPHAAKGGFDRELDSEIPF